MIEFKIEEKELFTMVNQILFDQIKKSMVANTDNIQKSLNTFFEHGFLSNKKNKFDESLDWVVECAFRTGVETAMEEMNLKEIISNKVKEIMTTEFISDLAEEKVRASLGLGPKQNVSI